MNWNDCLAYLEDHLIILALFGIGMSVIFFYRGVSADTVLGAVVGALGGALKGRISGTPTKQ